MKKGLDEKQELGTSRATGVGENAWLISTLFARP